jgi:hypothetical protein
MTTANRFSALFKPPMPKIASTDDQKCSYTNDFPSLEEAKKVPAKFEGDLKLSAKVEGDFKSENKKEALPTDSRKQTQTKIILGHRSYEKELCDPKRVEAYELLADKEKLGNALAKTRMCNSIDKNEVCTHGDSCRFAHNLSELKISNCLFGDKCHFIRMSDGKLQNNGSKICNHKHPQESTENFMSRVGLDRYKKSKQTLLPPPPTQAQFVPPPPPIQAQFVPPPPPTQAQFVPPPPPTQAQFVPPPPPTQAQFVPPPPPTQAQFVPPPPPTQAQFVPLPPPTQAQFVPPPPPTQAQFVPPTEQILIIRVPKELASQALEIAMKNGRMNIQVEII